MTVTTELAKKVNVVDGKDLSTNDYTDEDKEKINKIPDTYTYLNILDVYPIGSIYLSINETNPSTLFGGTWEQLKDRFLLGAGDTYKNGETGGESEHTLTLEELPEYTLTNSATSAGSYTNLAATGSLGWVKKGVEAHNNMPPYLVVYMWKRVS